MEEITRIDPSAIIHETSWINPHNVVIEKNVKIGPFCSIGCDGFQVDRSKMMIVPHKGKIIIKANVELLSHCDVDLGLNEGDITLIGENCKISHYVHVAHNCHIGKNTLVGGHTNLGGADIGENCYIQGGCNIQYGIKIGDNVEVTIGSVVTKDVEANKKVSGFWAVDNEKWVKFIRSIR